MKVDKYSVHSVFPNLVKNSWKILLYFTPKCGIL